MMDPPREEAAVAIAEARRAGIRVVMITGDHPRTAARIATDLGIADAGSAALTGSQIDALGDAEFADAVRRTAVYARVSPAHKLRIVDTLQADGNIVAMTGDGVNDAPALESADIGIAMGVTGTEVTKEAARMILADDNFATIVKAVREGRNIVDNIRKFLRYLLSSNMGEVLTVFLGVVGASVIGLSSGNGAVVLPLLATQILWLNLITDSWPALAMGIDPPTDDVMARKPRQLTERSGPCALSQHRLRNRAAKPSAMDGVCGDGQQRALVQRAAQAAATQGAEAELTVVVRHTKHAIVLIAVYARITGARGTFRLKNRRQRSLGARAIASGRDRCLTQCGVMPASGKRGAFVVRASTPR